MSTRNFLAPGYLASTKKSKALEPASIKNRFDKGYFHKVATAQEKELKKKSSANVQANFLSMVRKILKTKSEFSGDMAKFVYDIDHMVAGHLNDVISYLNTNLPANDTRRAYINSPIEFFSDVWLDDQGNFITQEEALTRASQLTGQNANVIAGYVSERYGVFVQFFEAQDQIHERNKEVARNKPKKDKLELEPLKRALGFLVYPEVLHGFSKAIKKLGIETKKPSTRGARARDWKKYILQQAPGTFTVITFNKKGAVAAKLHGSNETTKAVQVFTSFPHLFFQNVDRAGDYIRWLVAHTNDILSQGVLADAQLAGRAYHIVQGDDNTAQLNKFNEFIRTLERELNTYRALHPTQGQGYVLPQQGVQPLQQQGVQPLQQQGVQPLQQQGYVNPLVSNVLANFPRQ